VMAAKSKPIERPSLSDLGLNPDVTRPTQTVASVEAAPAKTGGRVIEAGPETAGEIADLLSEARVI
jgi:electron transfer flavoprotein alpha/beta subunit